MAGEFTGTSSSSSSVTGGVFGSGSPGLAGSSGSPVTVAVFGILSLPRSSAVAVYSLVTVMLSPGARFACGNSILPPNIGSSKTTLTSGILPVLVIVNSYVMTSPSAVTTFLAVSPFTAVTVFTNSIAGEFTGTSSSSSSVTGGVFGSGSPGLAGSSGSPVTVAVFGILSLPRSSAVAVYSLVTVMLSPGARFACGNSILPPNIGSSKTTLTSGILPVLVIVNSYVMTSPSAVTTFLAVSPFTAVTVFTNSIAGEFTGTSSSSSSVTGGVFGSGSPGLAGSSGSPVTVAVFGILSLPRSSAVAVYSLVTVMLSPGARFACGNSMLPPNIGSSKTTLTSGIFPVLVMVNSYVMTSPSAVTTFLLASSFTAVTVFTKSIAGEFTGTSSSSSSVTGGVFGSGSPGLAGSSGSPVTVAVFGILSLPRSSAVAVYSLVTVMLSPGARFACGNSMLPPNIGSSKTTLTSGIFPVLVIVNSYVMTSPSAVTTFLLVSPFTAVTVFTNSIAGEFTGTSSSSSSVTGGVFGSGSPGLAGSSGSPVTVAVFGILSLPRSSAVAVYSLVTVMLSPGARFACGNSMLPPNIGSSKTTLTSGIFPVLVMVNSYVMTSPSAVTTFLLASSFTAVTVFTKSIAGEFTGTSSSSSSVTGGVFGSGSPGLAGSSGSPVTVAVFGILSLPRSSAVAVYSLVTVMLSPGARFACGNSIVPPNIGSSKTTFTSGIFPVLVIVNSYVMTSPSAVTTFLLVSPFTAVTVFTSSIAGEFTGTSSSSSSVTGGVFGSGSPGLAGSSGSPVTVAVFGILSFVRSSAVAVYSCVTLIDSPTAKLTVGRSMLPLNIGSSKTTFTSGILPVFVIVNS